MTALETECNGVDAVRADGGLVHIRTVTASDLVGLRALHAHASDRSIYLRFFSRSRAAAEDYLATLIQPSSRDQHALVACIRGEIVGVAEFGRRPERRFAGQCPSALARLALSLVRGTDRMTICRVSSGGRMRALPGFGR